MKQQPLIDDVGDPTARHAEDFYATPTYQTRALLRRLPLRGVGHNWILFEPCAGDGAIVRELPAESRVVANDIVPRDPFLPDYLLDATKGESWKRFNGVDVVLTNPPFDCAIEIARHAYEAARIGMALLLRLSWLEPTENQRRRKQLRPDRDRGPWLKAHPPTACIVLPRHDYRNNGDTDSVTSAWVLWAKQPEFCAPGFDFVTKEERDELQQTIARERMARR